VSHNNALMWDAFDMPHLPIEEWKHLPQEAGVYIVYKEEQTLYIGEAHNIHQRFVSHHRLHQFIALSPGVEIAWRCMPNHTPNDRASYERSLIAFFKPYLNSRRAVEGEMPPQLRLKILEAMLYLRQWRLYRKLTLKQLQSLTGIDFRILSKYENGTIGHPDTQKMAKLAAVLAGNLYILPPIVHVTDEQEEPARV
jgi:hypothetical protein